MANTKVSQLSSLSNIDSTTVFLVSSNTSGTLTSYKTPISSVSNAITANLGNISSTNLDGNSSNVLYGNGVFSTVVANSVNILNTNGLTTVFYPTFVENRTTNQIVRADVDLSYRTDTNTLTVGNITANGNVVANNFSGNITITGNVTGTSPNVTLVAGNYSYTFDNTGIVTFPTVGGDEGGEINLGIPASNTTLITAVKFDVFQDRIRFFDGSTKGAYIDLSQAGTGVSTLLNNRVSGYVNAGTYVTMDNLTATVSTAGNRSLQIATVSGSFSAYINGLYSLYTGGTSGSGVSVTVTTTPALAINWNFTSAGDLATYIISDTTNNRCYRVTMLIGGSYNNNMISIERLI